MKKKYNFRTLEERERAYAEARRRILGDDDEKEDSKPNKAPERHERSERGSRQGLVFNLKSFLFDQGLYTVCPLIYWQIFQVAIIPQIGYVKKFRLYLIVKFIFYKIIGNFRLNFRFLIQF